MTVKLRYKRPDGGRSQQMEAVVKAVASPLGPNLGFASAVAEFGMLLRESEHAGTADFDRVGRAGPVVPGEDPHEDRAGFITLAERAAGLMRAARVDRR